MPDEAGEPIHKRRRVTVACDSCRSKKSKVSIIIQLGIFISLDSYNLEQGKLMISCSVTEDGQNVVVVSAMVLLAHGNGTMTVQQPQGGHRSSTSPDPFKTVLHVALFSNVSISSGNLLRTSLTWPGLRWRRAWLAYKLISTKPRRQLPPIVPVPALLQLRITHRGTWVK